MTQLPKNIHASLICIETKGVLIAGPSGCGKTTLLMHLYRRCHYANIDVHIVSDDQTLLDEQHGALMGDVPPALAGKIEVRGYGIVKHGQHLNRSRIELYVQLGSQNEVLRYWDSNYETFGANPVKKLVLSAENLDAAGNAVFAALDLPLWV